MKFPVSPWTDFKSKFEVERKDPDGYNSSATSQQQHPSPLLPLPTPPHPFPSSSSAGAPGAGGVPVATSAHIPDSTTDSWSGYYAAQRKDGVGKPFSNKGASLKQRCRDYDGRSSPTVSLFLILLQVCQIQRDLDDFLYNNMVIMRFFICFAPTSFLLACLMSSLMTTV